MKRSQKKLRRRKRYLKRMHKPHKKKAYARNTS
jgi:hypothetical protein